MRKIRYNISNSVRNKVIKMKKKIILMFFLVIIMCLMIPIKSKANFLFFWDDPIYREPTIIPDQNGEGGLDQMIKDAEEFINDQGATIGNRPVNPLREGELQKTSSEIYTIVVVVGTALTVGVGLIIGIKYMVGSIEEKAEYKKILVPYVVACATIYGSLGIWKLLVNVLGSV